jgi:hypothetical protein
MGVVDPHVEKANRGDVDVLGLDGNDAHSSCVSLSCF